MSHLLFISFSNTMRGDIVDQNIDWALNKNASSDQQPEKSSTFGERKKNRECWLSPSPIAKPMPSLWHSAACDSVIEPPFLVGGASRAIFQSTEATRFRAALPLVLRKLLASRTGSWIPVFELEALQLDSGLYRFVHHTWANIRIVDYPRQTTFAVSRDLETELFVCSMTLSAMFGSSEISLYFPLDTIITTTIVSDDRCLTIGVIFWYSVFLSLKEKIIFYIFIQRHFGF